MYVVTGATGNVGRPLVRALESAGVEVRAVSRNAPRFRADLADPAGLREIMTDAEALFLLVSGAGAHLDIPAILHVASSAGVRRIVALSSQAAGTRPESPSHAPLRDLEDTVRASGLQWTILRPGGFASNTLGWADQIRTTRTVAAPFGDTALPVVDPADIAEVAAATLTDPAHSGRVYELTGPGLTTPRERTAAIAAALGEPVAFHELSPAEARRQLLTVMPEPVADGTLAILGSPTPAEQRISPDISDVLGRPARPFTDWLSRNLAAFRPAT